MKILVRIMLTTLILSGCTPFEDKMNAWIGHPIAQVLAAVTDEPVSASTPDAQGRIEYSINMDPKHECVVHFLVDQFGSILSWRSDGKSCQSLSF
jgi:hypothetical protein